LCSVDPGFEVDLHDRNLDGLHRHRAGQGTGKIADCRQQAARSELGIVAEPGKSPAVALFNGPYYFAEQLGFRKMIDSTFMIAAMINGSPEPNDIGKYFRALRRAQRDIDLRPDLYTHYYKNEFPERFHAKMDTRSWGPGERIVFDPYSKEMFERSFDWVARHGIFEPDKMGSGQYEAAVISLA
jgi:hypothetical protein